MQLKDLKYFHVPTSAFTWVLHNASSWNHFIQMYVSTPLLHIARALKRITIGPGFNPNRSRFFHHPPNLVCVSLPVFRNKFVFFSSIWRKPTINSCFSTWILVLFNSAYFPQALLQATCFQANFSGRFH